MWLDREEEGRVVFLLFSYYTWKVWEWFALSFALVIVPILIHTCWIHTFSCASWERTVLSNIRVDSNWVPPVCISVDRTIHGKFEFTLHAHSRSFANIIVLCRLGSVPVVFLFNYYRERTELKWKSYMIRVLPKRNRRDFQTFYICPRSPVGSAQWDWGIRMSTFFIFLRISLIML